MRLRLNGDVNPRGPHFRLTNWAEPKQIDLCSRFIGRRSRSAVLMTTTEKLLSLGLLTIGAASVGVWTWLFQKTSRGEAWIVPRFRHTVRTIPKGALLFALVWIVSNLWLMATSPGRTIDDELILKRLRSHLAEGCLLTLFIFALVWTGVPRRTDLIRLGFRVDHWRRQLAVGGVGFLASLLPVYLMRVLTLPIQSDELVHPLLRIVEQQGMGLYLWPVAMLAIVLAPLQEELLFRVLLQSWIETFASARTAIVVASLTFAAVHGFPDALGIFPLALVLGYIYQRERSFPAVVVLHSSFNAFNLLLTLVHSSLGE